MPERDAVGVCYNRGFSGQAQGERREGSASTRSTSIVEASAARADATWKTQSTKPELHLEICSSCHPFFTGKQKLLDTEGRVERFSKKYGAQTVGEPQDGRGGESEAKATVGHHWPTR